MHPAKTLVVQMNEWTRYQEHFEWYADDPHARIATFDGHTGRLPDDAIEWFTRALDVILYAETPYDMRLLERAAERGIATVVQANPEFWRNEMDPGLPRPTLVVNPSTWRMAHIPGAVHLAHPVARDRLPFRRRSSARRFLHVAGHPAIYDRAGTELVLQALEVTQRHINLTIRTQAILSPRQESMMARLGVRIPKLDRQDLPNYWDLYEGYDVLVLPRRYGGNNLPLAEAASCGMPVVAADRVPERDLLPPESLVRIGSVHTAHSQAGLIPIESVDVTALARKLDELADNPDLVGRLSDASNRLAEARSWEALGPQWWEMLERAVDSVRAVV
jgi:hypothetical protein